jgi:hypothetical protein
VLLVGAVAVGLDYGGEYVIFAPWAFGLTGRPTLTGDWMGTLRAPNGTPQEIYLQLGLDQTHNGTFLNTRGRADLDGHLSWCAPGIRTTTSEIYGSANRSASSVIVAVNYPGHPRAGLDPFEFHGAWHTSTLVLRVMFLRFTWNGHGYSSGMEVGPVRLTLHKSGYGAFQAACAHL